MNKTILMGRLTKDPEVKYLQDENSTAMAIVAYCTNGKELPNALLIEPFNVLYQTAEDGIADTIKPRLAKCGADMTKGAIHK